MRSSARKAALAAALAAALLASVFVGLTDREAHSRATGVIDGQSPVRLGEIAIYR